MEKRSKTLSYSYYASLREMDAASRELIERARSAAEGAVAPYSHFRVGAAALLSSGEVLTAANVESEVYPAGICAERNLLYHLAASYPTAQIVAFAVTSPSSEGECYPCGLCRQTLLDTERRQGSPIAVIMAGSDSATVVECAEDLLPFSFKLLD